MFIFNVFFCLMCLKVSIYFFNKKIKKVKLYGKDGVYFFKKKLKRLNYIVYIN